MGKSALDKAIDKYASKLKVKRHIIAMYAKLRVIFAMPGDEENKMVYKLLIQDEYTFTKTPTKVAGIISYSVDVDSIDEAYRLKKKIKKINKSIKKTKQK